MFEMSGAILINFPVQHYLHYLMSIEFGTVYKTDKQIFTQIHFSVSTNESNKTEKFQILQFVVFSYN